MKLRPDEIASILKEQIAGYEGTVEVAEVGTVLAVGDGIARVYGLGTAMAGELLEFPHGVTGLALNLEEDNVGARSSASATKIVEGDVVKRTGRIMSIPVGEASSAASSTRSASRSTARARIEAAETRAASRSRRPASSSASR